MSEVYHAKDKESGKAAHSGEWAGILGVVVFTVVLFYILMFMTMESNKGQAARLTAIEFQLSCDEEDRFVDKDGDVFCRDEID